MMAARKFFGYRGAGKLPTTRWTMVMAAGQDATAERDKALAELCAMYWTPVYGFIRAMGRHPEEARDLTQGFFTTTLLEKKKNDKDKNDIAAADPTRGRFRNWLLTAVKNYLTNDLARARAKKRNPGTPLISIDTAEVEGECPIQVGHDTTPERVFDRRWAMVLLGKALHKLEESYKKRGDEKLFAKMIPLLTHTGAPSHRAIAEELGMQEKTFNVALSRCRTRFQDQIREEVAETVIHKDEVDDELRFLLAGL